MGQRPFCPEVIISCVIGAIIPPALADIRHSAIASARNPTHWRPPTAMAGENEVAKNRRNFELTIGSISAQSGQHLLDVGVEACRVEKALCFRTRTQRRRDKDDIASAVVDTFAQCGIGETLAVPVFADRLPTDCL